MSAGTYNIEIEKGIYYDVSFTLKDSNGTVMDVTDFTFRAEVRRKSDTGLIKSFTVTKTDAENGVIQLKMIGSDTSALPVGVLKWDLIAKDGADKIRRYLGGKVTITDSVSNTVFV